MQYDKRRGASSIDLVLGAALVVVGGGLAVFLLLNGFTAQIGLPSSLAVAGIVYVGLASRKPRSRATRDPVRRTPEPTIVVIAALATTIVAGLATVAGAANTEGRPLWTILLPVGVTFGLWAQVLVFQAHPLHLPQIIIIGASVVLSTMVVFPYDGGDTWVHVANAEAVVASGSISSVAAPYSQYPLYPAVLAALAEFSQADVQTVARLLNAAVAAAVILLTYGVVRSHGSRRAALIAALLIMSSKWFVYWSSSVVAMTVAAVLFCFIIAVLFQRLGRSATPRDSLAMIGAFLVLPFLHPVVAAAAAILLVGYWLLDFTLSRTGIKSSSGERTLLVIAVLAPVVVVSHWAYGSDVVFTRAVNGLAQAMFSSGQLGLAIPSARSDLARVFYDDINYYLLLATAAIGVLMAFRSRSAPLHLMAGIAGFGFVLLGYALQLANLKAALPDRWFLFATVLLVFPATAPIMAAARRTRATQVAVALGGAVVLLTAITNNQVNKDSPLMPSPLSFRPDVTSSEHSALDMLTVLLHERDVTLRTDSWFWSRLQNVRSAGDDVWYWDTFELTGFDGIFSGRQGYSTHLYFGYSFMGPYNAEVAAELATVARFYDVGDTQLLERIAPARE